MFETGKSPELQEHKLAFLKATTFEVICYSSKMKLTLKIQRLVQIQAHEVNPVLSELMRFSSGTLGGKLFSFSMNLLTRTRWKLGGAVSHLVTMREKKRNLSKDRANTKREEVQSREIRLSLEPLDPTWQPGLFTYISHYSPIFVKPVQIRFLPLAVISILICFVSSHCDIGVSCQDDWYRSGGSTGSNWWSIWLPVVVSRKSSIYI